MKEAQKTASFGIRLDAATLARLDAYAEQIGHKRGGAAARAIAAGLDALEGLPVAVRAAPPVRDAKGYAAILARLDALEAAELRRDKLEAADILRLEEELAALERAAFELEAAELKLGEVERRATTRLTGADVGRWVGGARGKAHKLARLGGGGVGEYACGLSFALGSAALAADSHTRCAGCAK